MQPEIVVAIIGGIVSISVAIIAASEASRRGQRSLNEQIVSLNVRVDLLWEIYIEDAIKQARESGLVANQSAAKPTQKWIDPLPSGLGDKISFECVRLTELLGSPYDASIEVWHRNSTHLLEVARASDMEPRAILGTIYTICSNKGTQ